MPSVLERERTHAPGSVAELLALALPMVASHACETFMMFVDRLFLARLGPEYMSAAFGGGVTVFMFMTFFMGLTGYANAIVAQLLGSGRKDRCAAATAQALLVTAAAYPLILACIPLGIRLFHWAGVAAEQLGPQTDYFRILMFGTVVGLLRNTFSSFFSGIGRTRVVMGAAMAAMAVNIAANYALIFGHWGFPALGIRGAALGTILGSLCGTGILAAVYAGRRYRTEFGTLAGLGFNRSLMKKLLRYGSPSGLEIFLNVMAFNFLILNFHSYGVNTAAAMTIMFNWEMLCFIPLLGLGIGVTSLVGRSMGAGDPDTAHRSTLAGAKTALAYTACAGVIFLLFAEPLVEVFRPEDGTGDFTRIQPLAIFMLRMVIVYIMMDALAIVFSSALRGAGDTFWTMVLSVSGHWGFTLVAGVLIRVVRVEPKTAWTAVVFMIIGLCSLFLYRYRSGKWRECRIVEDDLPPPPVHEDLELPL